MGDDMAGSFGACGRNALLRFYPDGTLPDPPFGRCASRSGHPAHSATRRPGEAPAPLKSD
ncbi:hypothetical protein Sfulv_41230 [Streptomyces fulvorobeus]|uniref:Uncharacterized protein n=1 Tax=Streptomyces fulvorobeus TaxID=284028 RepID=A0A7J0CA39_9ACTN|nr:hypothetical protein Sfulv_41230 [Streptomyces fulvorobeus]